MRRRFVEFFQTMDVASFWFGVVCSLWLCMMLSMAWTIICLLRDRRQEKYGRHSESSTMKENASAVTEAIPVPAETPRSHRAGRTDTADLPIIEREPSTRGARVIWHKQ